MSRHLHFALAFHQFQLPSAFWNQVWGRRFSWVVGRCLWGHHSTFETYFIQICQVVLIFYLVFVCLCSFVLWFWFGLLFCFYFRFFTLASKFKEPVCLYFFRFSWRFHMNNVLLAILNCILFLFFTSFFTLHLYPQVFHLWSFLINIDSSVFKSLKAVLLFTLSSKHYFRFVNERFRLILTNSDIQSHVLSNFLHLKVFFEKDVFFLNLSIQAKILLILLFWSSGLY